MNMHRLAGAVRTVIAMSAFALCCNAAQAVGPGDATFGPVTSLTAHVTESRGSGVLFDQSKSIDAATPGPFQQTELLHLSDLGGNGSGRSTQISKAFGSALAQTDNEGGVGVSIVTDIGSLGPGSGVHRMSAEALFGQTIDYHGNEDAILKLQVHIPIIEVGLLGVPPFTSAPRATETAQATAELEIDILRADGTHESGPFFQFGMIMTETQIELAPGTFSNFINLKPLFQNVEADRIFAHPDPNEDRVSFDAVTLTPTLGTLHPGDSLTYVYSLNAIETTAGGEGKGGFAFIGDPFNVVGSGGNLVPLLTPVPEPAAAAMLLAGLLLLSRRRFGRVGG